MGDLDDFRTYCLVDEALAQVTVDDYTRKLQQAQREGVVLHLYTPKYVIDTARAFLAKLRARVGPGGYNSHVKALNAYMRYRGIEHRFKPLKAPRVQPKALSAQDLDRAFAFTGQTRHSTLRARALLQFAFTVGARTSEVAALEGRDLDPEASTVEIRKPAKGGLRRTLPVPRELWDPTRPFTRWLRARPLVDGEQGPVWTASQRGLGKGLRAMKKVQLTRIMDAIRNKTGVGVNFVVARHTVATRLRRAGADVLYIKYYLGHSKLQSTSIYIEMSQEDAQREYEQLPLGSILPKKQKERES